MKKYLSIMAVAALAAYATSAVAQGTLGFNNSSTTLVKYNDPATSTLVSVPKNSGFVQIYYAPSGTAYVPWTGSLTPSAWLSANAGWTLGDMTPIAPVAGRFNGGIGGITTLNGVAKGASADFAIIGWSGSAASFDAAFAAGAQIGVSPAYTIATGGVDPLVPPPSISTVFTGLNLQPIPEPSTLALAGLGAAALLIFRRRK